MVVINVLLIFKIVSNKWNESAFFPAETILSQIVIKTSEQGNVH